MTVRKANALALLLCVLFVYLGSLWIWRPGIQSDEALFASGIYPPFYFPAEGMRIFKRDVAVMIMSYVGALKGHLWTPFFKLWGTSAETIRFPALLVGGLSIWVFYRLVLRTLGLRAALIACALLATDVLYMLTIRWDWGPVALQHLFLLLGLLGVVAWRQSGHSRWLALGFFAFGLGLWDKALFIWSLAGLGVATLVVFPRALFGSLRWRPVAMATLAFAAGAFPLIRYNVRHQWVTFRANTVWTTAEIDKKVELLRATLNGSALFGSIMRDDWEQPIREPATAGERLVVSVSQWAKGPRTTVQSWLFGLSLLLLPLVWRTPARKAILFALVFMVVTWVQMAFVENAGGGAHHTILLWPMPQWVIAAAIGYASLRVRQGTAAAVLITAGACLSNFLVLSTYYTNLIRNGSVVTWTEAIYQVADALKNRPDMDYLCVADWGFFDNIHALHDGRIQVCVADDPASDQGRQFSLKQIANPRIFFIAHTPGNEVQPGIASRIEALAQASGFRKQVIGEFADANGRPAIQVFTFRPAAVSK